MIQTNAALQRLNWRELFFVDCPVCQVHHVVMHLHKIGWLDTKLNTDWDSNAFQFYAGDIFDLINNLYLKVSPR